MKRVVATIAATLMLGSSACTPRPHPGVEPVAPRLVVLIIVDQMRADRLAAFADRYESGLARLRDEGTVFENAHHAHAMTWTAAGIATLTSGVHPSRSGIIGNHWWDRGQRARVDAVTDPGTRRLDRPDLPGASPFHLRVTALGDWLKQMNPSSQVWSVAIKDRAAVLAGGRHPDGAFWYDFERGRFVTSSYYMDEEPAWALAFDSARSVEAFRGGWHLLRDENGYTCSDAAAGEDEPSTFPHLFSNGDAYYREIFNSPFGDRFTFDFATALIDGQRLGTDDASDLLIVGASSGDEVGHSYGPVSREVEDYYLRLDLMLGEFFDHLDTAVGRGGWLVALSSDHGVLPLPEQTRLAGTPAERHSWGSLHDPAQSALAAALNDERVDPGLVRLAYDNGWVLDADPDVAPERLTALRSRMAASLRDDPRIEDVFTWDELVSDTPLGRPYEAEFRRSFDAERSADLMLRFREFDLAFAGASGTNHGSAYAYDTHVPMVFLGAGIPAQRIESPIRTVDLAPTLASYLGIEPPAALDGKIIRYPQPTGRSQHQSFGNQRNRTGTNPACPK